MTLEDQLLIAKDPTRGTGLMGRYFIELAKNSGIAAAMLIGLGVLLCFVFWDAEFFILFPWLVFRVFVVMSVIIGFCATDPRDRRSGR